MKKYIKAISFLAILLVPLFLLSNPLSEPKAVACTNSAETDYTIAEDCAFASDETTTTAADSSTNANKGTPTGTTIVTGKYGSGRSFNGSSDYVSVADDSSLQLTTALTAGAWFKTSTTGAIQGILRKDTETDTRYLWGITVQDTNVLRCAYYNGTTFDVSSVDTVTDGEWHHAAMTIDGTSLTCYLDGVSLGSANITGTQGAPTGELDIGANPPHVGGNPRSRFFNGSIDDARIYNYARSEDQIAEDIDNGSITGSAPVGWWKMDDGYTTGVDNLNLTIPSGKSLTINAGQTVVWNPGKGITVEGTININTTGQLKQGYLWVSDSDTDGWYYDATQVVADSQPTGYVRQKDTISSIFGDGSDGAVTFNTDTNISTTAVATGRTAPDGAAYAVGAIGTNSVTISGNSPNTLWYMDEAANDSCSEGQDACDSSGNGNHGIATGTTIASGKYSNARSFNGTSDYVEVNTTSAKNVFAANSQFTVEFWFNATKNLGGSNWMWMFSKQYTSHASPYYQVDIRWLGANTIQANVWRSDALGNHLSATSTSTLTLSSWNHVAMTVDLSTDILKLYINGDLEATDSTPTGSYTNWNTPITIGANKNLPSSSTYNYGGKIDDLRIYDYVRGGHQILDDMHSWQAGLAADDNVLLINLRGDTTNYGNVGKYEILKVQSVSGNTVTFTTDIKKIYGATTSNSDLTNQKVMIQRIPQYSSVTINEGVTVDATRFRGNQDGAIAMMVSGTYTANTGAYGDGTISMAENGYRGGDCNGCADAAWGDQGEGIKGSGTGSLSAKGNGGGGGYGPSGFGGDPGAGGGHASGGGNGVGGGGTAVGGSAVGEQTLGTIFMGGGAGAGGDNDNFTPLPQYVNGGGIIMLFADTISSLYATANGENGIATGNASGGVSGSGAGGSILIKGRSVTLSTVTASGGTGASDSDDTGGVGSVGRIAVYYTSSLSGTTTPSAYSSQVSDAGSNIYLAEVNEITPNHFFDRLAHSLKTLFQ